MEFPQKVMQTVYYVYTAKNSKMSMNVSFLNRPFNVESHYLNTETADVVFKCGKEPVPAHKILLAGYSNAFNTMFYGTLREGNEVEIVDATPHGFREFLRYFYFSDIHIRLESIYETMYLSKKYLLETYFQECCKFLSQQDEPPGIIIGYEQSIRFALKELRVKMEHSIRINSDKIFQSEYFTTISQKLLKKIIRIPIVRIEASKCVFDGCIRWAREACKQANIDPTISQNLRDKLGDCFQFIEFSAMTSLEITECVERFGDLFTSKELQSIIFTVSAKSAIRGTARETKIEVSQPTQRRSAAAKGKVEGLFFVPQKRMLLKSFSVSDCFGFHVAQGYLAMVAKMSSNNEKQLLHIEFFPFEGLYELREDIILEPNATYVIEIMFLSNVGYVQREIIRSAECPITILPETNTNFIASVEFRTS